MVQLATMSEPDDARRWLMRASELGYAPAMMHLSDMLMQRDPVEALSWLYAAVTLSGDDAARKRAAALAREMTRQGNRTGAKSSAALYAKRNPGRTRQRDARRCGRAEWEYGGVWPVR